jgi:hypothetical protein
MFKESAEEKLTGRKGETIKRREFDLGCTVPDENKLLKN